MGCDCDCDCDWNCGIGGGDWDNFSHDILYLHNIYVYFLLLCWKRRKVRNMMNFYWLFTTVSNVVSMKMR